jgi:hypothetical protein
MQEVYNDAFIQIKEATDEISRISKGSNPTDVNEVATITKEKGNLLKIKDSAIKIKLEVAKLHADILKNNDGNESPMGEAQSNPSGSLNEALEKTRQMIRESRDNQENK